MKPGRPTRDTSCEGKKRFTTFSEAKKVVRSQVRHAKPDVHTTLNAYRCQFCGSFHVGHAPRETQAERKARDRKRAA